MDFQLRQQVAVLPVCQPLLSQRGHLRGGLRKQPCDRNQCYWDVWSMAVLCYRASQLS